MARRGLGCWRWAIGLLLVLLAAQPSYGQVHYHRGYARGLLYRVPVDCGAGGCFSRETGRLATGQALPVEGPLILYRHGSDPELLLQIWLNGPADVLYNLSLVLPLKTDHPATSPASAPPVAEAYYNETTGGPSLGVERLHGQIILPQQRIQAEEASCPCDDGALELLLVSAGPDGQLDTADDEQRRLSEMVLSWEDHSFCRRAERLPLLPELALGLFTAADCPVSVPGQQQDDTSRREAEIDWEIESPPYYELYEPGGCELEEPDGSDSYYEDGGGCGGEESSWPEEQDAGCEGDSGGSWEGDDGGGCEGDSGGGWEGGDSGGGCEGDSADSGWSSSGSDGCEGDSGGGGCEGDYASARYERSPGGAEPRAGLQRHRRAPRWQRHLGGLLPFGIFSGFLGVSRRRRRRARQR